MLFGQACSVWKNMGVMTVGWAASVTQKPHMNKHELRIPKVGLISSIV